MHTCQADVTVLVEHLESISHSTKTDLPNDGDGQRVVTVN